jgi:hypothetical protein
MMLIVEYNNCLGSTPNKRLKRNIIGCFVRHVSISSGQKWECSGMLPVVHTEVLLVYILRILYTLILKQVCFEVFHNIQSARVKWCWAVQIAQEAHAGLPKIADD